MVDGFMLDNMINNIIKLAKTKSNYFILVLLFGINNVQAQHLTYLGIPIDGSMADFSQKLVEKGFKQVSNENNSCGFYGKVLNDSVITFVYCTYKTKTVYSVTQVKFSKSEFDSKMYLSSMKELYRKKYESNAFYTDFDNLLKIIENGETIGYLGFSLSQNGNLFFVNIIFNDNKNLELNDKEKISDL